MNPDPPPARTAFARPRSTCVASPGFTLIELLVTLVVIALLASLLLPLMARAKESGRAAACLSNLHQAGLALQLYVQENNNKMPVMRDYSLTTTNDLPTPDLVLSNYLGNVRVLWCPSDKFPRDKPLRVRQALPTYFVQTGSSYGWSSMLNGQDADHLNLIGFILNPHEIPLLFDKDPFHAVRGPGKGHNWLYADGHLKNLLAVAGTAKE